jgi:ketosteroid isomerase-like protein
VSDERARWARHAAIVEQMLVAVSDGDVDGYLACVDDDVVYEAPYYAEMAPRRGRDELASMLTNLSARFASVAYEVTRTFQTVDPDLVIAEVRGDNAVRDSDRRYRNHYVMFVRFRDDLVVQWTEYSNPMVYRDATDERS